MNIVQLPEDSPEIGHALSAKRRLQPCFKSGLVLRQGFSVVQHLVTCIVVVAVKQ